MFLTQSFMFNLTNIITMTAPSAHGHTVILELSEGQFSWQKEKPG